MAPKLSPWAFVLAVHDLDRSAAWCRDVLGCRVRWAEGRNWRLVERDGMRLMLGLCPNDLAATETGSHNWFGYLEVDDVDALHAEITARGGRPTAPRDAPYGMREIVVTTIDGHRIVFGQEMGASP